MNNKNSIEIDGHEYVLNGERNVLEVARKAGIDIPTFCYHSELSVYGACRMCLVEIEGRGIVTSCSTPPQPGMIVHTNTRDVRKIRRINLELLLANHERECTTCLKNGSCSLQTLARTMGIDTIRFKPTHKPKPVDYSSISLIRNPNKCVLCGDCVRFCSEIQSIGAIDFAYRGANAEVKPTFGRPLGEVECVDCGQCSRVCPTGAIVPRSEIDQVWDAILDEDTITVAQVAPAIRVALGEHFGMASGTITTGKIAAALRRLGFDKVYDTCFTADLTVLEEGEEFLQRLKKNEKLPLFTSCCPSWVKFAEQYYPDLLPNLSTCRSPQQMFGSLAKAMLPERLGVDRSLLRVVSIMPCTAKKSEARRPEFRDTDGIADVDQVLTSQELGRMIESAGLRFEDLPEEPFDHPLGFASGAGTIFGTSGGVTEAVVRYAAQTVTGEVFGFSEETRGIQPGIRELKVTLGDQQITAAVVFGLANARKICREVRQGQCNYQIIEVMACPGGCINGAGQPISYDAEVINKRGASLYQIDSTSAIRSSLDNPELQEAYQEVIGPTGGSKAHSLLHTHYSHRRRVKDDAYDLLGPSEKSTLSVEVCIGTNCCLHGAHDLLKDLTDYIEQNDHTDQVHVKAAFCFERCGKESPVVRVGDTIIGNCTFDQVRNAIDAAVGVAAETG